LKYKTTEVIHVCRELFTRIYIYRCKGMCVIYATATQTVYFANDYANCYVMPVYI